MKKLLAIIFLLIVCFVSRSLGETVYFIVGEVSPDHNETYVLPLTDANDIAHARDLIAYGPDINQPLVVANIECGMNGINRNYLSPIKAVWNWHVTDFNGFSDIGDPDGYPALVQNDCEGWMEDTNGYIGF